MSVNKVILIGNLGRDPDARNLSSGAAACSFSIATTEVRKNKDTGERIERTEWHRIVMFSRLAEIAIQYLKKGSKVYIEGKLRTNKWQDSNGNDRYTTEIIADSMQMLGSRADANTGDNYSRPAANEQQQSAPPPNNTSNTADKENYDSFNDDIPF